MAEKRWDRSRSGFCSADKVIDGYVPDLPKHMAARLTRTIMRLSTLKRSAKFFYGFKKSEFRGRQVLILAQHTSRDDPYYVNAGYPFIDPNVLMSRHNVLIPVMFRLLLADGVILKSLYEPDIGAMRNLMRLYKRGASFLIFPEGIQSTDGTTQPVHKATAGLIKRLALDTVICTSHGAYLCNPRFDTNKRKGRLEYRYELLFSKEDLKDMTEDEIHDRLIDKFVYNDFAWNSKKQYIYKGDVPCAHGIDNLLFVCPCCKKHFGMHTEGDRLVCECGSAVTIDDRYNLIPADADFPFKRIDEWYGWQREVMEEEVKREDFCLSYDADYLMLNTGNLFKGRFKPVGEGRIELDRNQLRYKGTREGETVELAFDISRLPSATTTRSMANEIYYDGVYHQFAIRGDRRHAAKIMLATEVLHEMGNPERSRARKDVEEGYKNRGEE